LQLQFSCVNLYASDCTPTTTTLLLYDCRNFLSRKLLGWCWSVAENWVRSEL